MSEDTPATPSAYSDLQTFLAWLWEQQGKVKSVLDETEQVQRAFTTRLMDMQQRLQDAQVAFVAAAEAAGERLEPWLTERLQEQLPAAREAAVRRQEELRAQLADLEAQRIQLEEQSARERQALAEANPKLNAREEELKAERSRQEAQIRRLDEELAEAGAGLGWLFQPRHIHRLRTARQRWDTARIATLARLNEVRQAWANHCSAVQEQERTAQREWRGLTARIAQLTGEAQALDREMEAVCRRRILLEVAQTITEATPTGTEMADEALHTVVALRTALADLQAGIASVAEVLGLCKGIHEGLGRFAQTVRSMKQEQDMHPPLCHLQLEAPEIAVRFHEVWDVLLPIVSDENAAQEHPVEFGRRLQAALGERLTAARVAEMFEALGASLKEAADSQWNPGR